MRFRGKSYIVLIIIISLTIGSTVLVCFSNKYRQGSYNEVSFKINKAVEKYDEVHLMYEIDLGKATKGAQYESTAFGKQEVREVNLLKEEPIGNGAGWSTENNIEQNKILIDLGYDKDREIGKDLTLHIEDIYLFDSKKSFKEIELGDSDIEIKADSNLFDKFIISKVEQNNNLLMIEVEVYSTNRIENPHMWIEVYNGDENLRWKGVFLTSSSRYIDRDEYILEQATFDIEDANLKDLRIEINYNNLVKEIDGIWNIDFKTEKDENEPEIVSRKINKEVEIEDCKFTILGVEKTPVDVNVYVDYGQDDEVDNSPWMLKELEFEYGTRSTIGWGGEEYIETSFHDIEYDEFDIYNFKIKAKALKRNNNIKSDIEKEPIFHIERLAENEEVKNIDFKGYNVEVKSRKNEEKISLKLSTKSKELSIRYIELVDKYGNLIEGDYSMKVDCISPRHNIINWDYIEDDDVDTLDITIENYDLNEIYFVINGYDEYKEVNEYIIID